MPCLLSLPLDIRFMIYDYLLPTGHISRPIANVRFAECSRKLPEQYMLLVHPQLTIELLEFYASRTTWKIILRKDFQLSWTGNERQDLQISGATRLIKDVSIVVLQDIEHHSDEGKFDKFQTQIKSRIASACDMLAGAPPTRLRLSWIENRAVGDWERRAQLFRPFKSLGRNVQYELEDFDGPTTHQDRETFEAFFSCVMGCRRAALPNACWVSMPEE